MSQVRAYGLDLEQRIRAAKMKGEHSDSAGLQRGEQRQEPVALEGCAAPARLRLPRNVQDDQGTAFVPEGGESGAAVLRQRECRYTRSEREAARKRIVRDHRRAGPAFRRVDNAPAPEPDAVQCRLPAPLALNVDGEIGRAHV